MKPTAVAPRLKALRLRAQPTLSTRSMAKALGLSHTSYTYYESDFKEPSLPAWLVNKLIPILVERGIPADEIRDLAGIEGADLSGQNVAQREQQDKAEGMARIEEWDVRGAAGAGTIIDNEEQPETVYEWQVPRELVRSATYASPDKIKIITVVGDSMEGTFRPFERVMVDTTDTVPTPPGIFVVYDGLGLVVKRVEHIPHSDPPTVRITSDNPRYQPYERTLGEAYIQGRVLGRWQWV